MDAMIVVLGDLGRFRWCDGHEVYYLGDLSRADYKFWKWDGVSC